jgi:hypothetical protein
MADFNQSPIGQTSVAIPLTGIAPVSSATDPVWEVPRWPQASALGSLAISLGGGGGGGGGAPPVTVPTTGLVWPVVGSVLVSGGAGGGSELIITSDVDNVDEGGTVTFTLTTDPPLPATDLAWQLSGVSSVDVVGGVMSGTLTTNGSGVATLAVELVEDSLTEGPEVIVLTAGILVDGSGVTVNDTSISLGFIPTFETGRGGYSLSEADKTAVKVATDQRSIVWAAAQTTGKYYTEMEITLPTFSADVLIGLADTGSDNGSTGYIGFYVASVGFRNGEYFINGFTGQSLGRHIPAFSGNSTFTFCIACDFDAKRLWIGIDGSYRDSGDPAAGTNPNLTWTSVQDGRALFPALRLYESGQSARLKSSYLHLPSGFENWPV